MGWVVSMKLWGYPTDTALDLPDALTASSGAPEQRNPVGIGLWVVPQDQAEQGGLAGAVRTDQRPFLSSPDGPVQVLQELHTVVDHIDALQVNHQRRARSRGVQQALGCVRPL